MAKGVSSKDERTYKPRPLSQVRIVPHWRNPSRPKELVQGRRVYSQERKAYELSTHAMLATLAAYRNTEVMIRLHRAHFSVLLNTTAMGGVAYRLITLTYPAEVTLTMKVEALFHVMVAGTGLLGNILYDRAISRNTQWLDQWNGELEDLTGMARTQEGAIPCSATRGTCSSGIIVQILPKSGLGSVSGLE